MYRIVIGILIGAAVMGGLAFADVSQYTDNDISLILKTQGLTNSSLKSIAKSMIEIMDRLTLIEKRLDKLTGNTPTGLLAQVMPPIPPIPPIVMPPFGTSACKQLYLCDANGNCRYETVCR